jgi:hypothetical protein
MLVTFYFSVLWKEEKEIIMGSISGVDRQNLEVKTSP